MKTQIIESPVAGLTDLRGSEIKVLMVCEPAAASRCARFNEPSLALGFWRDHVAKASWYDPEKEASVVLCLDRKNNIKAWNLVSLGTASTTMVHPREVFRPVIAAAATACVVMHNHPAGDPAPSQADRETTAQLRSAAEILGIEFLDHIIIGSLSRDPRGYGIFSFTDDDRRQREQLEKRIADEWAARKEARRQKRLAKQKAKEAEAA